MSTDAKQFVQCVRAVREYGAEISAMGETLDALFLQELGKARPVCKVVGSMVWDDRDDDQGWVCTDISASIPLARRKGSRPEMYLSYQVSLEGNGMEFPGNEVPLLHVCLWDCPIDFNEGFFVKHPMKFSNGAEDEQRVEADRLIVWDGEGTNWKQREWTFSVELLSLESSQALLDRVVKPAIALLNGEPAGTALPDAMRGLFRHSSQRVGERHDT